VKERRHITVKSAVDWQWQDCGWLESHLLLSAIGEEGTG